MKSLITYIFFCLLGLLSLSATALELTRELDKHVVHYTLFDSLSIPPDIAAPLQLKRGKKLAYINIAVIPKTPGFGIEPVELSGRWRNLLQQSGELKFKKIDEPNAIYYLAPVPYLHGELLHFDITVQPTKDSEPTEFSFTRTLFETGK